MLRRRRIAFDLDDTLIPSGRSAFATEAVLPRLARFWFREPLRAGTRDLLHRLRADNWDIWVYTTSNRSPLRLKAQFFLMGVRLGGVVNYDRTEALRRTGRIPPVSKYPPAWNIDLLVDDSDGVRAEGARHGFAVLVVAPDDPDWVQRVLEATKQH